MTAFNKYFFYSTQYKSAIDDLEKFISDHEDQFFQKFEKSKPGEDIFLTKFAINGETVDFTFALNSGQHICDSINIQDLMIWVSQIEEKEQIEKLKDFNLELEDLVIFLQKVQNGDLTCRLAAQILDEKIQKQNNVSTDRFFEYKKAALTGLLADPEDIDKIEGKTCFESVVLHATKIAEEMIKLENSKNES